MMERLPIEILEDILASPKLSIEDVVNFSTTSSYFRNVITGSNMTWKKKFAQKWPTIFELVENDISDWYSEVQYVFELKARTRTILSTMSPRFCKKYELSDSDLVEWDELLNENHRVYYYLVQDLMDIVNTNLSIKSILMVPVTTPGNKTLQYYASKVLRHVRQQHLSHEWQQYMSLPPEKQILEKGAVFVAQWCQPQIDVRWKDIALKIDEIAKQVKDYLLIINPNHPIFKIPPEEQARWREENLECNQYNATHCRQIIVAMGAVLYKHLNFSGNNSAYYMPENSFINEVLDKKRGLPITLAVVYESIARRLGLRCEPISFPAHFLLRFTEGKDPTTDSYYIDVFNNGDIIRKGSCPHSRRKDSTFPSASARQVVERMANNLEVSGRQHTPPNGRITRLRSSLELLKLVNPNDISSLVNLARLYMLHNMDTKPLINFMLSQQFENPDQAQRIVQMLTDYETHHKKAESELFADIEPARRPPHLKFAVGMVMKHFALNYKCVIYDWDPVCLASSEWQAQMNVSRLTLKDDQPFYNVLVEDGSHRYVAQENLVPTSDTGFLYLNEDIGRHFSHFFETHYVPNAEKEKEYPEDTSIRHFFHHKLICSTVRL